MTGLFLPGLGLPVSNMDIERAIAGYRAMFNAKGGYFPTSIHQPQHVGQDTLYGALCRRTEELLHQLGLERRRNVLAGNLAYAEQRALEIGITIAGGAEIILLDEPTAGMSHAETEDAVALIRKVSAGRTLMMIEHDMGVVFDLADRISVLVYGQIIACDAPAKIKADPAVQQAYLGTVVAA